MAGIDLDNILTYFERGFKLTLEFFYQILLATILVFVIPFILILSLPIFLCRILVQKSTPWLRPDLAKMLTTHAQIFAIDDFTKPNCNIVWSVVLEGDVDVQKITDICISNTLEARLEDGELRYPELKQYMVKWGGYFFWKDDPKFKISNHIKVLEKGKDVGWTEEEIHELKQELIEKKWKKRRPLWGATVLKNYHPKGAENPGVHTVVLFRFSHALGDGFSLLYLTIEGMCEAKVINVVPNYFKRGPFLSAIYFGTFPFRLVWETAGLFVHCLKSYPWRIRITKEMKESKKDTGRFFIDSTTRIPISKIKDIKSHFKTSFIAVQSAILGGAIRDMLIKKGMDVPELYPSLTVLPYPGHRLYKLRNYMGGAIIYLPTYEEDPVKRLMYAFKDYNRIKRSTFPIASFYFLFILGCYFSWITKLIMKYHFVPAGFSSFPGGLEHISLAGHKCIDAAASSGLLEGQAGLGFLALSYVDGIRFSPMADASIMSKKDLRELSKLVEKHVDILHQCIKQDV